MAKLLKNPDWTNVTKIAQGIYDGNSVDDVLEDWGEELIDAVLVAVYGEKAVAEMYEGLDEDDE